MFQKLKVSHNDILRSLLGVPRYTSARKLSVKTRQDKVYDIIRSVEMLGTGVWLTILPASCTSVSNSPRLRSCFPSSARRMCRISFIDSTMRSYITAKGLALVDINFKFCSSGQ